MQFRVVRLIWPPSGMASRAFSTRFSKHLLDLRQDPSSPAPRSAASDVSQGDVFANQPGEQVFDTA